MKCIFAETRSWINLFGDLSCVEPEHDLLKLRPSGLHGNKRFFMFASVDFLNAEVLHATLQTRNSPEIA